MKFLQRFIEMESASGILLFVAAILALIIANSGFAQLYQSITAVSSRFINDGLMSIFFLVVALELKREFYSGELSSISKALLPGVAALGGMLVPAIIYATINHANPIAMRGWAIPVATDIAFALGALSLVGRAVPLGLKLFLMALAIFDDLGAIIIIAIYYAHGLIYIYLLFALLLVLILYLFNRCKLSLLSPYLAIGILLWACVFKSGIHPTIAGVLLGFMLPIHGGDKSLLRRLEEMLYPWVDFAILPLFALANAGLSLAGFTWRTILDPLVLGIMLGLFLGKQMGVGLFSWLFIKFTKAKLPDQTNWLAFYGVAVLCGIGFTMSLFVGTLAFESHSNSLLNQVRLGVLLGSLVSGLFGIIILRRAFSRPMQRSKRNG